MSYRRIDEVGRLFVYGTLKRGFSNAAKLEGAVFEGRVVTRRGYALHLVSGYPALTTSEDGVVSGELYSVTDEHLVELDAFEVVPHRYQREAIVLSDGSKAQAYVVAESVVRGSATIGGGEFLEATVDRVE